MHHPPSPCMHSVATKKLALHLENVGVGYQRRRGLLGAKSSLMWALKDASLTLYEGETLGIVGRNGAGKSTLLRLLAGIIRCDRGKFINFGHSVTLLSLQVGFVQYLSGRENVMLSGLLMGMKRKEIAERMDAIVEFAELGDFIDEPIQTYSSGMKARLGFAAAFYVDPDILLIDEVLGVGDEAFVRKSKQVMREKIRSDRTVVLVSHSSSEIAKLCDRVVWIHKGVTKAEGATDEVLAMYAESLEEN